MDDDEGWDEFWMLGVSFFFLTRFCCWNAVILLRGTERGGGKGGSNTQLVCLPRGMGIDRLFRLVCEVL